MKTQIKIDIETKDFKEVAEADEDGMPTNVDITRDVEKSFHRWIEYKINQLKENIQNKQEWDLIEEFQEWSDCYIEGRENFEDYGNIKIEINDADHAKVEGEGK